MDLIVWYHDLSRYGARGEIGVWVCVAEVHKKSENAFWSR